MRFPNSVWPEARINLLKHHYEAGHSYAKIALLMADGLTREAIAGKVKRLGLTRTKKSKPRLKRDHALTRLVWGDAQRPRPVAKNNAPAASPSPSCEPVPRHLRLLDLGMNDCRWPYGDGPFTFCAAPKEGHRSYCYAHNRAMFARTTVR